MIIRIFVLLLALNAATFIASAEASEHSSEWSGDVMTTEEVYELQQRVSGEFEEGNADALVEIGSRLLSLSLVRNSSAGGKHYASQPAQADHGIALLEEGASLNLKWNF